MNKIKRSFFSYRGNKAGYTMYTLPYKFIDMDDVPKYYVCFTTNKYESGFQGIYFSKGKCEGL